LEKEIVGPEKVRRNILVKKWRKDGRTVDLEEAMKISGGVET
jgi:hypothetical protein